MMPSDAATTPGAGFFVTVNGTKKHTVIFAGDRWSDFAWTGFTESGSSATVTNVKGGANGSQYALQIGAAAAYSGGVRQKVTVPAGTYTLSTFAKTSGTLSAAQVTVTDAAGAVRTLTIPAASAYTKRELTGFALAAGTATVTVRAASSNGYLTVDQLSLVKTSTDEPPTTTPPPAGRYEAETAPAVCQGTIDTNQAGFSGTGFCNGNGAVGGPDHRRRSPQRRLHRPHLMPCVSTPGSSYAGV